MLKAAEARLADYEQRLGRSATQATALAEENERYELVLQEQKDVTFELQRELEEAEFQAQQVRAHEATRVQTAAPMTNPMDDEAHELRMEMLDLKSQITFDHQRIRALEDRLVDCDRFEREQFNLATAQNDAAVKGTQDEDNYIKWMENPLDLP